VQPPEDPNYHFSEDMTSKTIAYLRDQKAMTPDKPSSFMSPSAP